MKDFVRVIIAESMDEVPEGGALFRFRGDARGIRRLSLNLSLAAGEYELAQRNVERRFTIKDHDGDPVEYLVSIDEKHTFTIGVTSVTQALTGQPTEDAGSVTRPMLCLFLDMKRAMLFSDLLAASYDEPGSYHTWNEYVVAGKKSGKYMLSVLVLPEDEVERQRAETESEAWLENVLANTGVSGPKSQEPDKDSE